MSTERPAIEPMRTHHRLKFINEEQVKQLQSATLEILEQTGVRFPSEKALTILAEHGVQVDRKTQIAKFPRDLVMKAMSSVPRYFMMGARDPICDLPLQDGVTYFTTDGCGVETIDFDTHVRRLSCKTDVGRMAHVCDYLSSIAFYWPMVSAQDHGRTAPLHEMDASWNNTVKHVQSETIMGEIPARYTVEMATVIAGSKEELRRRPVCSLVVCTIAPLVQDRDGIEGALVLAEGGHPGWLPGHANHGYDRTGYSGGRAGDGGCRDHQRHGAHATGPSWGAGFPFAHASLGRPELRQLRQLPARLLAAVMLPSRWLTIGACRPWARHTGRMPLPRESGSLPQRSLSIHLWLD